MQYTPPKAEDMKHRMHPFVFRTKSVEQQTKKINRAANQQKQRSRFSENFRKIIYADNKQKSNKHIHHYCRRLEFFMSMQSITIPLIAIAHIAA